jgi:hypothetical protein
VILDEDVPDHEPPSETRDASASKTVHAPTAEGLPAVHSPASSSAVGSDPPDAADRDRVRLRAEVAQWDLRVCQDEIEHIITHHPYSKARALLWQARRSASDATPMEAAAD